jgi:SAM-dependent methyltransferase
MRDGIRRRRPRRPVFLGSLRRTTPFSDRWGFDRGTPIDRVYIEHFLGSHRRDIRGRVLEVKDSMYADRFGSDVFATDILDVDGDNDRATIVADLGNLGAIEPETFDCFILTQTLQYIDDLGSAIENARNLLRPGGVLLATVPGISRSGGSNEPTDLWRFTAAGCANLFGRAFERDTLEVTSYGNVLSGIAFLTGMAREELKPAELEASDDRFPVILAVRAVRQ